MNSKLIFLTMLMFFRCILTEGQDTLNRQQVFNPQVKGYHFGVVQPLFSLHEGEVTNLLDYDVYSIGFPAGISFATNSKVIIDLELVPFIAPALQFREKFEVHILYHPGILIPLKRGFTIGFRLAFESGKGQFGFTPLLNKSIELGSGMKYFIELVAPGRFGPDENSGYTQIFGIHTGIAF